jgi:CRP/FNR family transcriptional regulator, cyclic AMP receptor protein
MTWRYAENIRPKFRQQSLLGRIGDKTWNEINRLWSTSDYRSGQVILAAEEPTSDVCFLLLGTARATVFTESGREVSFLSLAPGDCFGEFSAIDLEPRSASVVASSDCTAARLTAPVFRTLVQGNTDMAFALASVLVAKLRALSQRISDFNALSADQRVRLEVVRLVQSHMLDGDSALLDNPPTQTDLAAYVFTNREGVAREMGRMKRAGVLQRRGRGIYVPSLDALRRYVEDAG